MSDQKDLDRIAELEAKLAAAVAENQTLRQAITEAAIQRGFLTDEAFEKSFPIVAPLIKALTLLGKVTDE